MTCTRVIQWNQKKQKQKNKVGEELEIAAVFFNTVPMLGLYNEEVPTRALHTLPFFF